MIYFISHKSFAECVNNSRRKFHKRFLNNLSYQHISIYNHRAKQKLHFNASQLSKAYRVKTKISNHAMHDSSKQKRKWEIWWRKQNKISIMKHIEWVKKKKKLSSRCGNDDRKFQHSRCQTDMSHTFYLILNLVFKVSIFRLNFTTLKKALLARYLGWFKCCCRTQITNFIKYIFKIKWTRENFYYLCVYL